MNHFGTMDALAQATEEEMMDIDDIGPISAHCVYTYFRQPTVRYSCKSSRMLG